MFSDRDSMTYTEAVLHETLRRIPILPLSLPHYTTRDTEVGGYFIPKDTEVSSNRPGLHIMGPLQWLKLYISIYEYFEDRSKTMFYF